MWSLPYCWALMPAVKSCYHICSHQMGLTGWIMRWPLQRMVHLAWWNTQPDKQASVVRILCIYIYICLCSVPARSQSCGLGMTVSVKRKRRNPDILRGWMNDVSHGTRRCLVSDQMFHRVRGIPVFLNPANIIFCCWRSEPHFFLTCIYFYSSWTAWAPTVHAPLRTRV